jgi:hypothetical protein
MILVKIGKANLWTGVARFLSSVEMKKGGAFKVASLFEMSDQKTPSVISSERRNLSVGVGRPWKVWREGRDFSQGSK